MRVHNVYEPVGKTLLEHASPAPVFTRHDVGDKGELSPQGVGTVVPLSTQALGPAQKHAPRCTKTLEKSAPSSTTELGAPHQHRSSQHYVEFPRVVCP